MRQYRDPKLLFVGARRVLVSHDANSHGDTVEAFAAHFAAGVQPLPMADAESACI